MLINVTINSIDRTDYIDWESFRKEDNLNSDVDTCSFSTKKMIGGDYRPNAGEEILVMDGATKIFAGVIVHIEENQDGQLLYYSVECKDWTQYLDGTLVVEDYENMSVADIIADMQANYFPGFTVDNVSCDVVIPSIKFNRIAASKCLDELAKRVNYNWYPDYDKDIHFFAKNTEAAPFSITDANGNVVAGSLVLTDDITQMRNRVLIRGGEMVGNSIPENFTGDGVKKTFALGHKISDKPTVTVGGSAQTVGVDYIDKDTDFQVLWNFDQKYVRFVNAPANGAAIVVTGTPLIPIIVQVQDDASISQFAKPGFDGAYEYSETNTTIKSKEEAKQYAISQLDAYASQVQEGSFQTYQSGLRSGQVITIQSDLRGINASFLIQRVSLEMRTATEGIWTIQLATLRTMGIIAFLQQQLIDQSQQTAASDNEVLEKYYIDNQTVQVTEEITLHAHMHDEQAVQVAEQIRKDPWPDGVKFVLGPYFPIDDNDNKRPARIGVSFYVY